jgi:2-C-methyl-D-erythritol 4-phosphate cytidylyltransferase
VLRNDVLAVVPIGRAVNRDLLVGGKPVLRWTLSALAAVGRLAEIVVVAEAPPLDLESDVPVRSVVVGPGTGRLDAIRAALAAASPAPLVMIHEADRPLTTPGCIEAVLSAAEGLRAAVAAVPARNTLKRVVNGRVEGTIARERLYQVQTPEIFDRALLEEALRRSREEGWDCHHELALATRAGMRPRLVPGDPLNVPISAAGSVPFAELTLARGRMPTGDTA